MKRLLLILIFIFCGNASAYAACADPAGTTGQIVYNEDENVMQYCFVTSWIAMGPVPGTGGAGCSDPDMDTGAFVYNHSSHVYQYCDGAKWVALGPVPGTGGAGTCADPAGDEGRIVYNHDYGAPQYCDGTNWAAMAPTFNPDDVAGLAGWWDASDPNSLVLTGTSITRWNSKVGAYYTSNHGTAPVYDSANDRITFNGTGGFLINPGDIFTDNDLEGTSFVVAEGTAASQWDPVFGKFRFNNINRYGHGMQFLGNNFSAISRDDYIGTIMEVNTNPHTARKLYAFQLADNDSYSRLNGVTIYTDTANVLMGDTYSDGIGAGVGSGTNYLSGYIYEILHYHATLSDADVAKIEQYLSRKWDIAIP